MHHETWRLWLDDQHEGPNCPDRHAPEEYFAAATVAEAQALVKTFGWPSHMDLDHDLGGEDVMAFLRWFTEWYPQGPVPTWHVHSKNPVGAKNIEAYLDSWRRSLAEP